MCGISGILHFDGEPASPRLLQRMIGSLRHRGPDAYGIYCNQQIGLAHARLSIIDLSGGAQPMHNEDRSLSITFNGEIFNYVELREELIRRGHQFASRSDTEVILHAYEEYGAECVRHFNGQWAFAIWDAKRRQLFLSRDRLGVRPLFYALVGRTLLFGSEIKALLAHPDVERQIDLTALDQTFTFWSPLPPRTIFKNIRELPPAHSLLVDGDRLTVERYWQLDYTPHSTRMTERECAERLWDLLLDATRLRLRSDVPIGAYLSGGLDSSITTALIRGFSDSKLSTFSVNFEDAEFDESSFQQEMVRSLRTEHHSIRCAASAIGRVFPQVLWHTERPILRTAPAPLFLLSQLVHDRGFKVVLTGEGADEMLGGYDIFKEAKIRRFWARNPDSTLRPLLLKRLYPYMQNLQSQSPAYLKAFFRVRPEDLASPFFSHLPRWELTSKLKAFFSPAVRAELAGYDPCDELLDLLPAEFRQWDPFCQAQYLETTQLLPGYILSSQGDRVAMAHSVEGRFPFLDYRLAEFAAGIPVGWKMRGLNEKDILKRVAREIVPASIRERSKQPYRAPDAKSFFDNEGSQDGLDYVADLLSPRRLAENGIFHPPAVEKLVEKCRKGQAIGTKDNMALVGILSTQLVVEQFVNQVGPISGTESPDANFARTAAMQGTAGGNHRSY